MLNVGLIIVLSLFCDSVKTEVPVYGQNLYPHIKTEIIDVPEGTSTASNGYSGLYYPYGYTGNIANPTYNRPTSFSTSYTGNNLKENVWPFGASQAVQTSNLPNGIQHQNFKNVWPYLGNLQNNPTGIQNNVPHFGNAWPYGGSQSFQSSYQPSNLQNWQGFQSLYQQSNLQNTPTVPINRENLSQNGSSQNLSASTSPIPLPPNPFHVDHYLQYRYKYIPSSYIPYIYPSLYKDFPNGFYIVPDWNHSFNIPATSKNDVEVIKSEDNTKGDNQQNIIVLQPNSSKTFNFTKSSQNKVFTSNVDLKPVSTIVTRYNSNDGKTHVKIMTNDGNGTEKVYTSNYTGNVDLKFDNGVLKTPLKLDIQPERKHDVDDVDMRSRTHHGYETTTTTDDYTWDHEDEDDTDEERIIDLRASPLNITSWHFADLIQ